MRPKVEEMAMLVIAEGGSTWRPSEKTVPSKTSIDNTCNMCWGWKPLGC